VAVRVGVPVPVAVAVGVFVRVAVGVAEGASVAVPVAVRVGVGVPVGVAVAVRVAVFVAVGVRVGVGVAVGVRVRVAVGVNVGSVPEMTISPSRIWAGMYSPKLLSNCTLLRMISDRPGAMAEKVMRIMSSLPVNADPSNACSYVITPVVLSAMLIIGLDG
jgi:hypothetical protein